MPLSIIIPALNEGAIIAASVERALALEPLEVLVVDGGSTDGTVELAARAGARVLSSPPGRALQLNAGIAVARGDVVLMLHADNWLEPDARQQIARVLRAPRVIGGAFRQRIDDSNWQYRVVEVGNALRAQCLRLPYGDQGIFLRTEILRAAGGFPAVPILEELLLMRSLRGRGRLALLPGPLHVSARRWQRRGIVRQTVRNWWLLAQAACGVPLEKLARGYYGP